MKDLTLDEMREIAAEREAANEALQQEGSDGTLLQVSLQTPTDPSDAL